MDNYLDPVSAKQMYADLLSKGYDKKAAAKEVQTKTGLSAVTWKPMKSKGRVDQYSQGITMPTPTASNTDGFGFLRNV